jgi:hypothetical protein
MAQVAEGDPADARQPATEEPAWLLPGVRMLVLVLGGIARWLNGRHSCRV